jgi:salicylate hydroxylase
LISSGDAEKENKLTIKDQGQGGAQCIEDSVALGLVFCGARKEEVNTRLRLYEKIRRNRASLMQVFSNAGQDEPELFHKEASKYTPLEKIPSMSSLNGLWN